MKIFKTILILVGLLYVFELKAQNLVVEVNNYNVVYRGYENQVSFGTIDGRPFELIAQNATLLQDENDSVFNLQQSKGVQHFILRPLYTPNLKTMVFYKDPITAQLFDSVCFTVKNLPSLIVHLGSTPDGQKLSNIGNLLTCRFEENVPLNSIDFKVVSWEMMVEGMDQSLNGQGNILDEHAMQIIKNTKQGAIISFMTQIRFMDGSVKKRSASFIK